MLGWHKLRQAFSHFGETCIGHVVIPGPIASYRRLSADPHEIPQTALASRQGCEKTFLVISNQQASVGKLLAQTYRTGNDIRGARTAINQVAEQNQSDVRGSAPHCPRGSCLSAAR